MIFNHKPNSRGFGRIQPPKRVKTTGKFLGLADEIAAVGMDGRFLGLGAPSFLTFLALTSPMSCGVGDGKR